MDKGEVRFDSVKVMSPKESYPLEIKSFQEFVSTKDITRASLIEGWECYWHCTYLRKEINRGKSNTIELFDPVAQCFLAADKRLKILSGEDIELTGKDRIVYSSYFLGDTTGVVGGNAGEFLRGLKVNEFKKAQEFCFAMNKVGLKLGDIDKVV